MTQTSSNHLAAACPDVAANRPATDAGAFAVVARNVAARLQSLSERPKPPALHRLIDWYMDVYAGRDPSRDQRLRAWRSILGDHTIERIDDDVIHAVLAELAKLPALVYKGRDHEGRPILKPKVRGATKRTATINRYHAALSAVFTWAIKERLTPKGWANPCRGIRRLREDNERLRFLTPDERTRLFEACKGAKYPRLYALALTAITTGGRKSELRFLRWRDVDLDRGVAYVGEPTKNGDRKSLVLLPNLVDALRSFASASGRFVFSSVRTKYQTPASFDTAFRNAVKRAGIKDFHFHDQRHCTGSYMSQDGKDIRVIQDVLGHRKLDMTRRYVHLNTAAGADAMSSALGSIAFALPD